eukprot:m.131884 g.131884  ORF g.131884 m.131884 type:complete len:391 (+) comp11320_c0_seq5:90-1262(+)
MRASLLVAAAVASAHGAETTCTNIQLATALTQQGVTTAVAQLTSCDTIFTNFTASNDTGLQRLLDFDGLSCGSTCITSLTTVLNAFASISPPCAIDLAQLTQAVSSLHIGGNTSLPSLPLNLTTSDMTDAVNVLNETCTEVGTCATFHGTCLDLVRSMSSTTDAKHTQACNAALHDPNTAVCACWVKNASDVYNEIVGGELCSTANLSSVLPDTNLSDLCTNQSASNLLSQLATLCGSTNTGTPFGGGGAPCSVQTVPGTLPAGCPTPPPNFLTTTPAPTHAHSNPIDNNSKKKKATQQTHSVGIIVGILGGLVIIAISVVAVRRWRAGQTMSSYNPIEMHNFDNAPPVEYDDDDEMVQLGGNEYEMDLSMHVPAPAEFDDGVEEEYGEY